MGILPGRLAARRAGRAAPTDAKVSYAPYPWQPRMEGRAACERPRSGSAGARLPDLTTLVEQRQLLRSTARWHSWFPGGSNIDGCWPTDLNRKSCGFRRISWICVVLRRTRGVRGLITNQLLYH